MLKHRAGCSPKRCCYGCASWGSVQPQGLHRGRGMETPWASSGMANKSIRMDGPFGNCIFFPVSNVGPRPHPSHLLSQHPKKPLEVLRVPLAVAGTPSPSIHPSTL